MRLLQFCNLANIVGGTGACGWSITRCFPDWQHGVWFRTGRSLSADTAKAFQHCKLYLGETPEAAIENFQPDVMIFHNISSTGVPQALPADVPTIYYVHSALRDLKITRERFDVPFVVSKHLASKVELDEKYVLYQPVPIPPSAGMISRRPGTIGRICTPKSDKWHERDVLPIYERLGKDFPKVQFEFVGAPEPLQEKLTAILGDRAKYFEPSWQMREKFNEWHMMVYNSSVEESYGRVVCEAQRGGCVPIVCKRGGFIEQINEPCDGFLCENPDDFSAGVELVLSKPWDHHQMRLNAGNRGSFKLFRQSILKTLEVLVKA